MSKFLHLEKKLKGLKVYLLLLFVACAVYGHRNFSFHFQHDYLITWADSEGYYMYLPALLEGGFDKIEARTPQFSKVESTQKYYTKYTCGVAIMEVPFFWLGHLYAKHLTDCPQDGYSKPYQMAIWLAGMTYGLLGLWLLFLFLRKRHNGFVSLLTILTIYFGTSLFYYTTRESGMSHVYSFFLVSALLMLAEKTYKDTSWNTFALSGLVLGLLILIRPTNVIVVLPFLLWQCRDWEGLKNRFFFILKHFWKFASLLIPFALLVALQLLLWRDMRGEWVFFSYDQEPGFIYFHAPRIWQVLFDKECGLFLFAPALLFAVLGMIVGSYNRKPSAILSLLVFLIATYLFGSWWKWSFSGAYGHRSYVELYPFFGIGFAIFAQYILGLKNKILLIIFLVLLTFFILYNTGMSVRYNPAVQAWSEAEWTWVKYWEAVLSLFKRI